MVKKKNYSIDASDRVTVGIDTLAALLDCGRATATKIGTDAGARIKVGRRVYFRMDKVNAYLDDLTDKEIKVS